MIKNGVITNKTPSAMSGRKSEMVKAGEAVTADEADEIKDLSALQFPDDKAPLDYPDVKTTE